MTLQGAVHPTAPGKVPNEARKTTGAQAKLAAPVAIAIEGDPSDEYQIVRSANPIWRSANGKQRVTNEALFKRGFRASKCAELGWIRPTPETAKKIEARKKQETE